MNRGILRILIGVIVAAFLTASLAAVAAAAGTSTRILVGYEGSLTAASQTILDRRGRGSSATQP